MLAVLVFVCISILWYTVYCLWGIIGTRCFNSAKTQLAAIILTKVSHRKGQYTVFINNVAANFHFSIFALILCALLISLTMQVITYLGLNFLLMYRILAFLSCKLPVTCRKCRLRKVNKTPQSFYWFVFQVLSLPVCLLRSH